MIFLDPPAVVEAAEPDIIEVIGQRADETLKIDRRTFDIRQTPQTAQKSAIDLLRGLPAVTVSPSEDILLLGRPSVQVFVDGRPFNGNLRQYLRTLRGAEVARIEIITNPSAQYSAEGSGGIINVVLRRTVGEAPSGSVAAEASSLGLVLADITAKGGRGKWAWEVEGHGSAGVSARASIRAERAAIQPLTGTVIGNSEEGKTRSRIESASASVKTTYAIDDKTKVAGKITAGQEVTSRLRRIEYRGTSPGFAPFSEVQSARDHIPFVSGELTFDTAGAKPGETLSASVTVYANPAQRNRTEARFSDGSAFTVRQDNETTITRAQLDWQRPLGNNRILSLGGSWNATDSRQAYRFNESGRGGALGPSTTDAFGFLNATLAAYATFQMPVRRWTLLPGVRVEHNRRRLSTPGAETVRLARATAFPTLHVSRRIGGFVDLSLSYSRRIDRAGADNLRPFALVEDVLTIARGNPMLRDQTTDAYELNLNYRRGKVNGGAILYHRQTRNLWTQDFIVNPAGVSVSTFVNAGTSTETGAQLDAGFPLLPRVKASVSANLLHFRGPVAVDEGRLVIGTFRYTSNINLDWTAPARGKIPGDSAQLLWLRTGPLRTFNSFDRAVDWVSFSYTHSLAPGLSVAATLNAQSRIGNRLITPFLTDASVERRPVELRLRLTRTFGGPKG